MQARRREVRPPEPGCPGRVESDYQRGGGLQYLCAGDVGRGLPLGRCESRNGVAAFDRLVDQVMSHEPYRSARRVFWIVDNGSSHRGVHAVRRLQGRCRNLILDPTPVHASWLSQVEICLGIVQRSVLTPPAAHDVPQVDTRILAFEARSRQQPRPFNWRFTRHDFHSSLGALAA